MYVLMNLSSVTSCVVLTVFFALSLVSAQNDSELFPELLPQSDLESIEELKELLKDVQLIYETKIANKVEERTLSDKPSGCRCSGLKCVCCKRITVSKLKLDGNACITVTYLPRNYGILVSMTFGERQIFAKEVSARNPPPVCGGIPYFKLGGSVCIQFYDLSVGTKSLSGCTKFIGKFFYFTIIDINTGCFRINAFSQQTREVEVPDFDDQQALMEGPEPIYIGENQAEGIKPAG